MWARAKARLAARRACWRAISHKATKLHSPSTWMAVAPRAASPVGAGVSQEIASSNVPTNCTASQPSHTYTKNSTPNPKHK